MTGSNVPNQSRKTILPRPTRPADVRPQHPPSGQRLPADHHAHPQNPTHTDTRLVDWKAWLDLSTTPTVAPTSEPLLRLHVHGGQIINPDRWPKARADRLYVAFDHAGAVYVGQTTHLLLTRIRNHFANQRSISQQRKAGTWQFVVSATFADLKPGDLDRLERSAAQWLLPLQHRTGRRHPRNI